jgi:hypothetical protein
LNVVLVLFPGIFKPLLTIPVTPMFTGITNISCSTFAEFLYLDSYILISSQLTYYYCCCYFNYTVILESHLCVEIAWQPESMTVTV